MLVRQLFLLIHPYLILGAVVVNIESVKKAVTVASYGVYADVISGEEVNYFDVGDSKLKSAIKTVHGGWPAQVFLRSPTPWGDLYKGFRWQQVRRVFKGNNVRVISRQIIPVIVMKKYYHNNLDKAEYYNVAMEKILPETRSSRWNTNGKISLSKNIEHKVNLDDSTRLSYTTPYNNNTYGHITIEVGIKDPLEITLNASQSAEALILANKGIIKIKIEYDAFLIGQVATNFANRHKGHYFWGYDIKSLLKDAKMGNNNNSTETVELSYYSDAKLLVCDIESRTVLLNVEVPIVRQDEID